MSDSRFGVFEEQTMDCTILATVLKRYLASLIIPMIPAEHHVNFLEIATGKEILWKKRLSGLCKCGYILLCSTVFGLPSDFTDGGNNLFEFILYVIIAVLCKVLKVFNKEKLII